MIALGMLAGRSAVYGVHRIVVKVGRLVGAMQGRGRRGCSLAYMSQCPHEDGGAKNPRCGTLGVSVQPTVGLSVSAKTHTDFAHRLPDAVNKAGTGRALRVMRIARTAQKNH